jgi:FkbM family methyltransferase
MNSKALARFIYANVPGVASVRFAAKDLLAAHLRKPEFDGIAGLSISRGIIVDVGANRGQSVAAFRRLAPACPVVAFEPEPLSSSRLKERYRGDSHVTVHNSALGNANGTIKIFQPHYGLWDCDGMASTDRDTAIDWLSDKGRMLGFDESKLTLAEHDVVCDRLDSYGIVPALIKLHAQGAEPEILEGAEDTIRRHTPPVICAFPTERVMEIMRNWDYHPYAYRDGRFEPGRAGSEATFTWFLTTNHVMQSKDATTGRGN